MACKSPSSLGITGLLVLAGLCVSCASAPISDIERVEELESFPEGATLYMQLRSSAFLPQLKELSTLIEQPSVYELFKRSDVISLAAYPSESEQDTTEKPTSVYRAVLNGSFPVGFISMSLNADKTWIRKEGAASSWVSKEHGEIFTASKRVEIQKGIISSTSSIRVPDEFKSILLAEDMFAWVPHPAAILADDFIPALKGASFGLRYLSFSSTRLTDDAWRFELRFSCENNRASLAMQSVLSLIFRMLDTVPESAPLSLLRYFKNGFVRDDALVIGTTVLSSSDISLLLKTLSVSFLQKDI